MRKFIFTVLAVAVFFVGLGGLVEKAGAKFKSDERALAIIAQARQAIGGDTAIKNVRGLTIIGSTEQTFTIDGATKTEPGNLEINLQMPNQYSKMLKIGKESSDATSEIRQENRIIITKNEDGNAIFTHDNAGANGKTNAYVIKKGDADKANDSNDDLPVGAKRIVVNKNVVGDASHSRQNELFQTTFALLLSAPEGLDVNYNYAGNENVDGNNCDVILAETGDSSYKLYIDQSSHLPVMMTYTATMPRVFKFKTTEAENGTDNQTKTFVLKSKDDSPTENQEKQVKVFTRVMDAPEATAEYQVKFSDYRNVGGVQLPYKWTQTVGGKPDQTVDIVSYEINPANIADKFKNQKILDRTKQTQ